MKTSDAGKIVQDCLEHAYNPELFQILISNILTGPYIQMEKTIGETYVRHAFKDFVSSYVIRGSYGDPEGQKIAILEIQLKGNSSLFNARTMQRNFVADFLKNNSSIGRHDGALVAYVPPKGDEWRFSFVKMEYSLDVIDGKIKTSEEITPAKRWSFLVGKFEKSHTAKSRLIPLVQEETHPTLFKEIEQAFDVETVTNEFFEKYKELFFRLREEMEKTVFSDAILSNNFEQIGLLDRSIEGGKSIGIANLAKKTLGQIAFLYFLQKKGWFGVASDKKWGEGPKNFLRLLFERREKYGINFFNDVLEPLFYEALATDRGEASCYTRLNNCRIPFLNGGLFEPLKGYDWERTNLVIDDSLFSNENKTKEGDIGDGILDIFDRYNFTVSEDEPLEKEVAVDPEMLGKIFENLLEIHDRKSKGAFYTPRPIVHYMCQESLIEYLLSKVPNIPREDFEIYIRESEAIIENDRTAKQKIHEKLSKGYEYKGEYSYKTPDSIRARAKEIDEALARVKIVDPAVGSGAFPLGLINEIVKARQIAGVHLDTELSTYELKLHTIEHSIFGVDLDPGAVEICQLRLWLSLVVDEDTPHPLPNLDYRIMQGNSLIEEFDGIKLYDAKLLEVPDGRLRGEQITFDSYAGNYTESERLYHKLQTQLERFVKTSGRSEKKELKKSIDALKWSLIETTLGEQGKIERLEEIKHLRERNVTPFFLWKLEFAEVFQKNGGFDIVIGNPPYVQLQKFARTQIQKDLENANFKTFTKTGDLYCLFYEQGIELSRKESGILTFITSNKWMRAGYGEKLREYFSKKDAKILIDCGPGIFETATVDTNILLIHNQKDTGSLIALSLTKSDTANIAESLKTRGVRLPNPGSGPWFIGSSAELDLKAKIERIGKPLKEWDVKINYGIKTGLNEAFIIDQAKRDELVALDPKSAEIIKPILRGRDIGRYGYEWAGLWLIQTGYDLDIPNLYPEVYTHLLEFEEKAKKRDDQGKNWWNLRACVYYEEFEKEKVVWQEMSSEPCFAYDNIGVFSNDTGRILTGENIKFFVGIFNSCFFQFTFTRYYAGGGLGEKGVRYKSEFMKDYPIPIITSQNNETVAQIEFLVSQILSAKKLDPKADTKNLEREIDRLVYELYELSPEEIAVVEGKFIN